MVKEGGRDSKKDWADPRTIVWVEAQPFLLRRWGATCILDGEIALRYGPRRGPNLDLTTSKRLPIIREGSLNSEDAVRKYIEYKPDDSDQLIKLNYKLAEGASIIVGGYRIKKKGVTEDGLYLGVAAAHEVRIWELSGNIDPIHASRKERARMRF